MPHFVSGGLSLAVLQGHKKDFELAMALRWLASSGKAWLTASHLF